MHQFSNTSKQYNDRTHQRPPLLSPKEREEKVFLCKIKGDCLKVTLKFKDLFIIAGRWCTHTAGII